MLEIAGGGRAAERLRAIVAAVPGAGNLAASGIGLDPHCRPQGTFEEVRKRRGQVHLAIGDNTVFGGQVRSPVHLDLVLRDPGVTPGGAPLVGRGRSVFEERP
ncbi:hypothetical protein [Paralimibaculum aggregatum]|uniref:hypothetical protein n=1 Tax=Paralimibaculum aggregatum TaxID=3036245 RepID=UPI00255276EC|nr:hypothetical protein [Limibaculum sp. NKW23]